MVITKTKHPDAYEILKADGAGCWIQTSTGREYVALLARATDTLLELHDKGYRYVRVEI